MKAVNDKALADNAGLMPSQAALAEVAGARTNKVEASTLSQDAAILIEAGKLDLAEADLKKALQLDPQSAAANFYLGQLKDARYRISSQAEEQRVRDDILKVTDAWEPSTAGSKLPVPNPYNGTNLIWTSKGRQAIISKLNTIRFDSVQVRRAAPE